MEFSNQKAALHPASGEGHPVKVPPHWRGVSINRKQTPPPPTSMGVLCLVCFYVTAFHSGCMYLFPIRLFTRLNISFSYCSWDIKKQEVCTGNDEQDSAAL